MADRYKALMDISITVIDKCEAVLQIGESRGADMERDLVLSKGFVVYTSTEQVPKA